MFGNDQFTKILLHMDGANASTTFVDNNAGGSAHTWTAQGNASISTGTVKFGTGSGSFGSGGILAPDSADFTLGSGDWTIDFWFNRQGSDGTTRVYSGTSNSTFTSNLSVSIFESAANVLAALVYPSPGDGTGVVVVTGTTVITTTGWHHCALVRTGNTLKLFLDGVQEGGDQAFSVAVNDSAGSYGVGQLGDYSVVLAAVAFMDEYRLSVGIARWTANFTPPAEPYDAPANAWVIDNSLGFRALTRNYVRGASFARGDDGTQAVLPLGNPAGWQIQSPQPPAPIVRSSALRFGALAPKEDGIEAPFVFVVAAAFKEGWQVQGPQPPRPVVRQRGPGLKGKSEFAIFPQFLPMGWVVQPPQPPHPRSEQRAAATMRGNDGTQIFLQFVDFFPVQPWQPPHFGVEKRKGAIARKEDGTEAGLIMQFVGVGFSVQPVQPPALRFRQRYGGIKSKSEFAIFPGFVPMGWPVQPPQPPNPQSTAHARAGGIMLGDFGAYDALRTFFPLGFPVQPPQPPSAPPIRNRGAAILNADAGGTNDQPPILRFFRMGFEVQPPQPPHPAPERRAAGTMRGDDGTQARLIPPPPIVTWQVLPVVPHPRREKAGALMRGVDGTDLPLFYPFAGRYEPVLPQLRRALGRLPAQPASLVEFLRPLVSAGAWTFDFSTLLPRRRRGSAIEIEPSFLPLPRRIGWGFDQQEEAPVLRRPRPSRFFAEAPLIALPRRVVWGFEVQGPMLRRPPRRLEVRSELVVVPRRIVWGFEIAAPLMRRPRRQALDRGYELVTNFPPRWTSGWETTPIPQPPHSRREKIAGMLRGDDGSQRPMIFPRFDGWEPVLFWPPHPRPESAGGIMAGDLSGAWGPFVYLVPSAAVASDQAAYLASVFDIGQAP